MNDIDTTVREALQERAEAVRVPPAASGGVLVARARRAALRRRLGAGAAAVAAAVAAVALVPHGAPLTPPRPAGSSPVTTIPQTLRAARSAALDWAARLPAAAVEPATGWPSTRRVGDRVSARVDGTDVLLPSGFTDLSEPRHVAEGWLFVASGASVGRSALLHVTRDGWKVLARPAAPTPLLVDPEGRRVALLVTDDQLGLEVIDIADGSIGGFRIPASMKHPALAAWTPFGISVIDVQPEASAPADASAPAGSDTTAVAMFDPRTDTWAEDSTRLDAGIVSVVRLDAFGASPLTPLVRTQQGSQACVSQLAQAVTLIPLECWPRSGGARPTALVSPGGRYALIGPAGLDGRGVTLRDLRTGRDVPGTPPEALAAGIGSYLWTGPDTFAAVVEPLGAPDRAVPYRYDIASQHAARLTEDPRAILDRTYDPTRTGLTLPDSAGG